MRVRQIDLEPLRSWFEKEKRDFPWRRNPTPYSVWVSEVMLQQTQSARVINYFNEWMRRFPTIYALASATQEEVFKVWEGLGYYSRARSLHEGAQFLVDQFEGQIPKEIYELDEIKGLGPYTISAIRAFAFHEKGAAVDGNVMRVLTRLFEIQDDITRSKTQQTLRSLADSLLPEKESWVCAEALIELGATFCKPKAPQCEQCPLQSQCRSFLHGTQSQFPVKSNKTSYEALFREVAVIYSEEHILLKKGQEGKVMAGLYEFPYFDCQKGGMSGESMIQKLSDELALDASFSDAFLEVKHSFTRFRVTLYPKRFFVNSQRNVPGYIWKPLSSKNTLTFSSGHKKIIDLL